MYILMEIVRSLMEEAGVEGNVQDKIDPAFYPVNSETGLPIKLDNNGKGYIGLDGKELNGKPASGGYGEVSYDENTEVWTVDWVNQDIKPESANGWHGTVFVKAKEDFLGGNTIPTNISASMTPVSYHIVDENGNKLGQSVPIQEPKEGEKDRRTPVPMDTPHVNIDELSLGESSTEWTVYLGTEVDPLQQLKALYTEIKVHEVVDATAGDDNVHKFNSGNTSYTINENSTADNTNPVNGQEQFALSSLPSLGVDDINWEKFIKDGKVDDIVYTAYGHNAGKISIELVKEIASGANSLTEENSDAHLTNIAGNEVEKYTLKVTYTPEPYDVDKDYHTGDFGSGSAGRLTDNAVSENEHIINVFAKKLELLKVDQSKQTITSDPATFVLYRKATADELKDDSITKAKNPSGLPAGDYVVAQTLTTSGGLVTTDALALLPDYEPYYLVETKAPAGYIALTEPLKVTIDMTGHNTWTKVPVSTQLETSQTKWSPYVLSNWLQEATIKVTDISGADSTSAIRVSPSEEAYDHTNDTTNASVTYKIINNAGAELPSSGGSGTTLVYLLGIMLTGLAGTALVMRRRRRNIA